MIVLLLILSCLSAVFGRAGGMSKDQEAKPRWIPYFLRRSWVRDWLCPVCALMPLAISYPSWWFVPAYGALGGMLTTYWDELFGYDNYWFSGFCCGLAGFFLITIFPWWLILIRAFILAILWGGINIFANKNDWIDGAEELLRYFLLAFSSIIFLF